MDADIQGCLNQIDRSYKAFVHKGKRMSKQEVKSVLEWGIKQAYTKVNQIPDNEIDRILENQRK